MSKEQIYEYYKTKTEMMVGHGFHGTLLSQEEFINKCKTDTDFSKIWGLKIEERELSEDERYDLCVARKSKMTAISEEDYIKYNIPTKLVTLTYNNETKESYE